MIFYPILSIIYTNILQSTMLDLVQCYSANCASYCLVNSCPLDLNGRIHGWIFILFLIYFFSNYARERYVISLRRREKYKGKRRSAFSGPPKETPKCTTQNIKRPTTAPQLNKSSWSAQAPGEYHRLLSYHTQQLAGQLQFSASLLQKHKHSIISMLPKFPSNQDNQKN